MDEGDEEVAHILGLATQDLSPSPAPGVAADTPSRRRAGLSAFILIAASVALAVGFTLITPRLQQAVQGPNPAPTRAETPKLDVLRDAPAVAQEVDEDASTPDQPSSSVRRTSVRRLTLAQRAKSTHSAAQRRRTGSLQMARAKARSHDAQTRFAGAPAQVDLVSTTETRAPLKEATLVQDRLEAIDALRLLRQR